MLYTIGSSGQPHNAMHSPSTASQHMTQYQLIEHTQLINHQLFVFYITMHYSYLTFFVTDTLTVLQLPTIRPIQFYYSSYHYEGFWQRFACFYTLKMLQCLHTVTVYACAVNQGVYCIYPNKNRACINAWAQMNAGVQHSKVHKCLCKRQKGLV